MPTPRPMIDLKVRIFVNFRVNSCQQQGCFITIWAATLAAAAAVFQIVINFAKIDWVVFPKLFRPVLDGLSLVRYLRICFWTQVIRIK